MVKAVKGTLIECDTSVKQIIIGLNEKLQFIIEDLDDTHVYIETTYVEQLRHDIDQILNENTYKPEEKEKK
ncbi:hypothetical protein BGX29_001860 [Mortierella sp. GBA35]|nr:hypothetical protein BGX23_012274 [Mortierella sp. AD031]KAF9104438.1 hypothetical protein BGX29_001860 [Mortierella sp. GBA35]KAG0211337.1 hypothetical protein BGX33_004377 [Mortierella sp. NVP41]